MHGLLLAASLAGAVVTSRASDWDPAGLVVLLAALATTLVAGLRGRGAGDAAASLAAEMGIAVFRLSFERWIESDDGRTLAKTMREYFDELKLVSAGKHA